MNIYDKYRRLRELFTFTYKGIEMNRVLAVPLFIVAGRKHWRPRQLLADTAYLFLAMNFRRRSFDPARNTVFTTIGPYSTARPDHTRRYDAVTARLGEQASRNEIEKWGYCPAFNPAIIVRAIAASFRAFRGTGLSFARKWHIAGRTAYYCNSYRLLARADISGIKKYLTLNASLEHENLLTQFFRQRGIPTYTSMEAIYIYWGENPPIGVMAYDNFTSDRLLCVGEYSRDQMIRAGIGAERLLVAGCWRHETVRPVKCSGEWRRGIAMMGAEEFRDTNVECLRILMQQRDMEFCLKLHPHSDAAFYGSIVAGSNVSILPEMLLSEALDPAEYDFALAVNTVAYYESYIAGLPCLRYTDGSYPVLAGLDDCFSDSESFARVRGELQSSAAPELQEQIGRMLRYAMGLGIDNYRTLLLGDDSPREPQTDEKL